MGRVTGMNRVEASVFGSHHFFDMAGTLVEQYWGVLIERVPEHYLTTFGTFVAHETMYFGFYIPFLLMDMIPFFKRWKIQEVSGL